MLVLDDYHVISDPAIIDSFQFLLAHLPPRMHLILAGRRDPPMALPRLRARAQVIELRDQDLRFTRVETEQFFSQAMKYPLSAAEADMLEQRVEGWIAGLQLAVLAMRGRVDRSTFVQQLNGGQHFFLDYMNEEILENQPQEVQSFLLHTSILTRLNPSLCQAVTKEISTQASHQMLLALEKANLFLVPLDEERRWFRYHSLFRDVLQARLQALSPEQIPILHHRAARWYAQQGNIREAITHALTGHNYVFAADLMEQSATHMSLNGEIFQLYAWIECLPDAILQVHTHLALTTVLQILFQTFYAPEKQWNQEVTRSEQLFVRIEAIAQGLHPTTLPETEKRKLHNRLNLLRMWIASRDALLQENVAQMHLLGTQLQELSSEENAKWKMLSTYHLITGKANVLVLLPVLTELKKQAEREQHLYEAVWMMERLGIVYRDIGQLNQAYQILREALRRLQQMGKARSLFGYIHLHLADFHWTRNQLTEARTHLDAALHFAQTWQHLDIQITGYYQALRIFLARGEWEEAKQALTQAKKLSQQSQWKHHHRLVMAGQAQIWLAQGNLAAASAWASHNEVHPQIPGLGDDEEEYAEAMALVRVFLALQRNTDALQLLAHLFTRAEENESTWHIIPVLAHQAAALYALGEVVQAKQIAKRLLQMADPTNYLRIYLDAGAPLQQVFQDLLDVEVTQIAHIDSPSANASIRTLVATFEQQKHQQHIKQFPSVQYQETPRSPISPLSARELEVLHLLAQGMTNQEIANQLIISLATAKKHVANILYKLAVENRGQATARAREYELL
ncbi:LuxR family transcriptional regulator [Ktedonospora formicarum]|uniref:LuxR family transcriptional regulator n=1 Tax=Ktedonospora formicarum TaxID=2778364 RepID=A0A8J3HXI2_9CHLR|nr:LuxR family transcriptional regulator [Ktedonospora formicarum]